MLRKRIIFTLIYCDQYFMQSRNFRLQKVGDLSWLEKHYRFHDIATSIDELIVLDASRSNKLIPEFAKSISRIVSDVFIPISAGGGIRNLKHAELLFKNGADKIVINSLLLEDPETVKELVKVYGSQSIIASIDTKLLDNNYVVFKNDGSCKVDLQLEDYVKYLEDLDIGELYLNSIDRDGTGFGYDLKLIQKVAEITRLPLIVAGGAGNEEHFAAVINIDGVGAMATANLFNFIGDGLPKARNKLLESQENIANWKLNSVIS